MMKIPLNKQWHIITYLNGLPPLLCFGDASALIPFVLQPMSGAFKGEE